MNAFNQTKTSNVATHVERANTMFKRMKGLLGKKTMEEGYGLWIMPCKSIHTFFMKFPIDVIFLSSDNQVVKLMKSVPPFRISSLVLPSRSVLELAPHTIDKSNTAVGDQIIFRL